ncbi:signal peptidase I [Candidatus Enterococcus ikei]|uniref:Signal peptidase I n=1 Tax=Candidatus Enterococcus ikei TaxID=2815326 RepID=A0ABS3GXG4_9ENTE|nr:signal peptidase I [Enterococcus sp. DIV0869a]MBO0439946.1 signal peptidase I [Enterococcus sp. DIV0869a]
MDEIKERFERLKRQLKRKFNKGKQSKNKNTSKNKRPQQPRPKKKRPHPKERLGSLREESVMKPRPKNREELVSNSAPISKKKKKKKLTKEEVEKRKKKRRKENIIEIVKFMFPVVLFALFVFFFILNTSPHMVDGDSMKPTLLNGDRVIVRRTKEPKRYEIITFKPPVKSEFQYVKRIIAMPGDLVWTEGNDLFINHQAESLPKVSEFSAASELPDGTIKINVSEDCLEQMSQLKKIPKGHYFVLGDNRNNSSDSRAFGLVDGQAIEGVVSFRFAPFDDIGWIK